MIKRKKGCLLIISVFLIINIIVLINADLPKIENKLEQCNENNLVYSVDFDDNEIQCRVDETSDINQSYANDTYLLLDASNDPLTGDLDFIDTKGTIFGTASDAKIYVDAGGNFILDSQNNGASDFYFDNGDILPIDTTQDIGSFSRYWRHGYIGALSLDNPSTSIGCLGDIWIENDSKKLILGAETTDYSIAWDGEDAVHNITSGDFEFLGGDIRINTDQGIEVNTGSGFVRDLISATDINNNIMKITIGQAATSLVNDITFSPGVGGQVIFNTLVSTIFNTDAGATVKQGMMLDSNSATLESGFSIDWDVSSASLIGARIAGIRETALGGGALVFYTRSTEGVTAERVRINNTGDVTMTANLTLGQKITFAFNEVIDNIIDGWITITGNLLVNGDLNVTGNITNNAVYIQASDLVDQTYLVADTPKPINLTTVDESYGITTATANGTNITVLVSGVYNLVAQPQVTAGAGGAGVFHMWLRKDTGSGFTDIPNTNIELSLASLEEDVILLDATLKLNEGDKIKLFSSVSDIKIKLDTQTPVGEPAIPSIIFTMYRIGS